MQIKLHEWCQLTPICCFVVSWVWTRLGLVCLAPCRTSPPGTGSRWHNWKTVGIHLRYQMRWGRSRSPLKAVLSWLLVVYAFLNYSQYMLYGCIYIYGQSVQSSKWGRFIPRLFLDFCLRCWSRMAMPLEGHTLFCCCASLPLDAQTRSCCTQTLLECDDYFQRLHLAPPWSIPTDLEDLRCWHSAFLWYYY